MLSFSEFVAMKEGLLATGPVAGGLPRINTTPLTQARRKNLVPTPVRTPEPLAPTIRPVAAVVHPHLVKQNRSGA